MNSNKSVTRKRRKRLDFLSGIMYLTPALLFFIVFLFYPAFKTLYLSFFLTDPQGNPSFFNGISNYIELFQSKEFLLSLKSTFVFIIYTVPLTIVISLFLAVLADEKLRGMAFYRVMYSVTLAISAAAAAVAWRMLFHPSIGLFNKILNFFNISGIGWLTDPSWALISISMTTIWMHIGFNFILLLGGLQTIPKELYESAKIDGASRWRQFVNITIPMLSPTLFFVVVVLVIGSFQSFGQIDILTQGGPAGSTNLIVYHIYKDAFSNNAVGSASAQAIILFVLILIFTFLQFKIGEKRVHYQ